MITAIIFIVIAYLVGSLSSAIIICRVLELPDPRTQGSHNPGATNVLRIGGKKAAVLTLLGDVLKSAVVVVLANIFGVSGFALGLVGCAAFVGHIFPLFFKFQGGKGVATAFGVVLALSWSAGLLAAATWLVIAVVFRYSSFAAIIAAVLAPLYLIIFSQQYGCVIPVIIMCLLLLWRHLPNIQRLRAGTESKIKF